MGGIRFAACGIKNGALAKRICWFGTKSFRIPIQRWTTINGRICAGGRRRLRYRYWAHEEFEGRICL